MYSGFQLRLTGEYRTILILVVGDKIWVCDLCNGHFHSTVVDIEQLHILLSSVYCIHTTRDIEFIVT